VKSTALKKYGFIHADDRSIGDVFFPFNALVLSSSEVSNPDLRRFPDGLCYFFGFGCAMLNALSDILPQR
jgi:hypothetical protein